MPPTPAQPRPTNRALFRRVAGYILLAALLYMPLFGHLNNLPIRIYDEARQAVGALEMYRNADPIVVTFQNQPDLWSTKPPLLLWFQAGFMYLIGPGELAVRLPSALAALLTCGLLFFFSRRYLGSVWFGAIAVLVLITSSGYVSLHGIRTGDYDAPLALFATLSGLLFFAYTETSRPRHLYLFFLATALAVLTKSIAGLLFLPGLALYALVSGHVLPLLRSRHFYLGILLFLSVAGGYYLIREFAEPGYVAVAWANDVSSRYLTTLDNHEQGYWFYVLNLIDTHFTPWFLLLPIGILVGLSSSDRRLRRITLFSSILSVTFLLIISSAQTKIKWYDLPVYPWLAILATIVIHYLFQLIRQSGQSDRPPLRSRFVSLILPIVFLLFVFYKPYSNIVQKVYLPQENDQDRPFYHIPNYLKSALKDKRDINGQKYLFSGYDAHIYFYVQLLSDIDIIVTHTGWEDLQPGDEAIVSQGDLRDKIESHYRFTVLHSKDELVVYRILGTVG